MWWCAVEQEDQGEYEGAHAARFWSSESCQQGQTAAALSELRCQQITDDTKLKGGYPVMHKLTRVPPIRSKSTIAAGIELSFANSGEMPQKGMVNYRLLEHPLLDSFS
jgi:hypothetical protein